jgi:predicted membrane protein
MAKKNNTLVKKEDTKGLKILIGLLAVALLLFAASMFDSNRISTMITGVLVILFAIATIAKIYGWKPEQ